MSFSRCFKLIAALLAVLVSVSFAAKTASGKFRYAVGDVFLHRNGEKQVVKSTEPTKLKQAKNVREGDDIETLIESEVIVALPDGSSFNVQENTIVAITKLSFDDGENNFVTEIKKGKMSFDVQKQANSKSNFKFKTGTATAAIRGTEGFVGVSKGNQTVASLIQGLLDFTSANSNKSVSIKGGQTVISTEDDFIVMDLSTSGNPKLFDIIDSLLNKSSLNADSLRSTLEQKDKELADSLNSARNKVNCSFASIPDTTYTPNQIVKATCTEGTYVRIFDEPILSNGSEIELQIGWAPGLVGKKRIPITCHVDNTTFPCGQIETYYAGNNQSGENTHTPLTVTSSSPLDICEKANAVVEGVFDTTDPDAVLTVSLGKQSSTNLFSSSGTFSYSFSISDKNKNWNEKEIVVNYESSKNGNQKIKVPLKINKTCKAVNLLPPAMTIYANKCKAYLSMEQIEDDKAIYTFFIDNVAQKEILLEKNTMIKEELKPGALNYKFLLVDQAENKIVLNKKLECYPSLPNAKIKVEGAIKERLRVPPAPEGFNNLFRQLRFTIAGLPNNDLSFIKQIVISQSGKSDIILMGTSIQSNKIDQQVEVSRGKTNKIKITVTLKGGDVLNAYKYYEVR